MLRVFISSGDVLANAINILDKDIIHHIKNVSRAKISESIIACDESGIEYFCEIEDVSSQNIVLKVKSKEIPKADLCRLTVACAIPKNTRFDDIVDKLTQIGVYRIIPLETDRTIVRIARDKANLRLERWRKIALSASEQSQRSSILQIDGVKTFDELIEESAKFDLKLIPTLSGERIFLSKFLNQQKSKDILAVIGPEGDFSAEEVKKALDNGFVPISLGNLVLRVDTAAIAVSSFILLNENN